MPIKLNITASRNFEAVVMIQGNIFIDFEVLFVVTKKKKFFFLYFIDLCDRDLQTPIIL